MPIGGEQLGGLLLGGEVSSSNTIEQAICRLLGDAIATPVVRRRPQRGELPVVTYRIDDGEADTLLDGSCIGTTARFEFRIYSEDYEDLRPIAKEIFARLNGFSGMAGDVVVQTALYDGEEDDEEDREDGGEGCVYVRALWYDVQFI